MATCEDSVSQSGLRGVRLENERLSVSLVPEAGGKIAEFVDRRSGRNWLWQNPHLPIRRPVYGADYGRELDSGGWDEILFSTGPCEIDLPDGPRCSIPDHGDLVGQPCEVGRSEVLDSGQAVCELTTTGRALDYRWRRVALLDAELPRLTLEYSLENSGGSPWPWAWCAHPLIAVERGTRIELPVGSEFRVANSLQLNPTPRDSEFAWPRLPVGDGREIDLSASFDSGAEPDRFAAKLFARSASPGVVSIASANQAERLTFRYDERQIPWLGLWINNRAWSGCDTPPYLNLGLEPSTSPCETLAEAIAEGWTELLEPGNIRTWSLSIEVGA
jgi:galactose mutarotase-like enzyme